MSDPHGQAFNVRFNRARRAERDLSEFLGLAKGLLADGVVALGEADAVRNWILAHSDAAEQWPLNLLAKRIERIYCDGSVDESERADLAELLASIVGGTASIVLGEAAATTLPLDVPPPVFTWTGAIFVFTGKFAFGTRADCERQVEALGASFDRTITKRRAGQPTRQIP